MMLERALMVFTVLGVVAVFFLTDDTVEFLIGCAIVGAAAYAFGFVVALITDPGDPPTT